MALLSHSFRGIDLTIYGLGEALLCFYFLKLLMSKKIEAGFVHLFPHVMESMAVWEFGFNNVYSGFQELDSSLCQWNVDSGIVSGIPVSLSCIPDSKAQDSEFYRQKSPGSRAVTPILVRRLVKLLNE